MKLNLLFLVAVVAAASCVVEAVSVPDGIEKDAHFEAFMDFTHQFEKKYATVEEFLVRMDNFKASMRRVAHLQALAGNVTQFGITQFSDMTPQEFSDRVLNPRMADFLGDISNITVVPRQHNFAAPTSFDWRTVPNVLSAVKNQGSCGSCWAFAAVEQLESMWYRRRSPSAPIVLSPQQLVSCSINNSGCNGGMAMRAWEWIKSKGGIVGESTYPYKSGTTKVSGTCAVASPNIATVWSGGTPWAFIQNPCTTDCPNVNVSPMKEYLAAQGPIQVNVCADAFQDYVSGVLQSNVCASSFSKMNHAVQAVGYNAAASPPYWIIRNSWSAVWAIKGYMYISMQNNACGVANLPATVFINGVNN